MVLYQDIRRFAFIRRFESVIANMLPRENRLTKRDDFRNVYKNGAFFSEKSLSLKVVKNSLDNTRIGFSIEKKYFKKAVTRNRVRRVIREAIQLELPKIKKGYDIVVFFRSTDAKINLKIISPVVEKLLNKSGLKNINSC